MGEEKHEGIYKSRKQIFFNNIIGGFGWAIGVTFGISLLIALLGFLASRVDLVPVIGGFVSDVIKFIISKNARVISLVPFLFSQYVYA